MLTPCESRGANYSELTEHDLARLEGAPRFRVTEFTALIKILREDLIWVEVAKKLGLSRTSPA